MIFLKNNKLTKFSYMKKVILILLFLTNSIFPQKLTLLNQFGDFSSASSFDIDLNQNIYVTDIIDNSITKYDSSGNETISIGGYGWEESTFDEPANIFTNTLSIYVADKNNNRVQRFDKDLNFLSQLQGGDENSEIEFGYPTCVGISNIGDLYLLETDNNKILKFNLDGNFLSEIGGNDAGDFALTNPKNFSPDLTGNIFVLDENRIKVFDQFGNRVLNYKIKYEPDKIRVIDNDILYIEKQQIVLFDLKERKVKSIFAEFQNLSDLDIIDAMVIGKNLYLLTSKFIQIYKTKN